MSFSIKDTKFIKLVTGEEIIAMVQSTFSGDSYNLRYPMSAYPNEQGEYVFVPFCGVAEFTEMTIEKSNVLCGPFDVQEAFVEAYAGIVGKQEAYEKEQESSIFVPNQSIVMPK